MSNSSNECSKEKWYKDKVIMSFLGVILGALIGFGGTFWFSQTQLEAIRLEQNYEIEMYSIERKEEIYTQIIQSIYSLQKMNDGLIEVDLVTFKDDSYTLMAQVRIYGSDEVTKLYNKFLTSFFDEKIYDGELVDNQLIPAIRKDIGIAS